MLTPPLVDAARRYLAAGLCPLPARLADKRPAATAWTMFQTHPPTLAELDGLMGRPDADALCLVCGAVSGHLELLDFDAQGEAYQTWAELVEAESPGLVRRLILERSQNGGMHAVYRASSPVGGNAKLAVKVITSPTEGETLYKGKTYKVHKAGAKLEAYPAIIETRGEGGIFLCAPSPKYTLVQGEFTAIPTITDAERAVLIRCAKSLNERVEAQPLPANAANGNGDRPGDEFNRRGNLRAVLVAHGWTLAIPGKNEHWRRPGKKDSWSATFNGDVFYVFSSNAEPFAPDTGYSRFGAYALLAHGGDYKAAAKALGEQGFGRQAAKPVTETPGTPAAKPSKTPPPPAAGQLRLLTDHPDAAAKAYIDRHGTGTAALRRQADTWLQWNSRCYVERVDADIRARLRSWLSAQQLVSGKGTVVHTGIHVVNEVYAAAECLCNIPAEVEPPVMLAGGPAISHPHNIIAFANGLLDLDTGKVHQHTPKWFSRNVLEYDYDPLAQCPQWLNFLAELSDTETDWLDALQMWFGYCLLPDTSQQKMLLMVGPPRSGKGTVCRVLQNVMGKHNYCNPGLSMLSESFGMEPLIGKLAAIIPDAHLARHSDSVRIMETLKSIIGEDHQTIRPIYKPAVNVRLFVRFTISVNELVVFPDAAGSMASRLIILPFKHSHTGNEDYTLGARLATESSGIANWAIEGIRRLHAAGRLLQPTSGSQIVADFARLSSPVRGFVSDFCVYPAPNASVSCGDMRNAWKVWCTENGNEPGSDGKFAERVYAACPEIKRVHRGTRDSRQWRYEGIALNELGTSAALPTTYGNLPLPPE
ncbi:MAG: phage/plasmid primase, P4 family [bacterium]